MHPVVRAILQSGASGEKVYLYKEGDECSAITGGWTVSTSSPVTVTKNASNIAMVSNASDSNIAGGVLPGNAIDLTNYTKLCVDATAAGSSTRRDIELSTTRAVDSYNLGYLNIPTAASRQTYSYDVSAINSSAYIVPQVMTYSSGSSDLTVYNIWLE